MDAIAHRLGMDPLEIQILNAFEEGSLSTTGQVLKSMVFKGTLIATAEKFGWKEWQQ